MNIIQVVGLVLVSCVAAPFLVGGIYLLVRDARRTGEWWLVVWMNQPARISAIMAGVTLSGRPSFATRLGLGFHTRDCLTWSGQPNRWA